MKKILLVLALAVLFSSFIYAADNDVVYYPNLDPEANSNQVSNQSIFNIKSFKGIPVEVEIDILPYVWTYAYSDGDALYGDGTYKAKGYRGGVLGSLSYKFMRTPRSQAYFGIKSGWFGPNTVRAVPILANFGYAYDSFDVYMGMGVGINKFVDPTEGAWRKVLAFAFELGMDAWVDITDHSKIVIGFEMLLFYKNPWLFLNLTPYLGYKYSFDVWK